MTSTTYSVRGMTCNHCAASVKEEISKVVGVTGVSVDLQSGRVAVSHDRPISDAAVGAAVEEAGYEVVDG